MESTVAEGELTVGGDEPEALPESEGVSALRERRQRFDEEWNNISEILSSVPLEPMVVNLVTKPADEDETTSTSAAATGPPEPRTTEELADEILETLTSEFELFTRFFLQYKA